ncbi:HNH endonuclease [Mycolicibacterium fortuitum]|nr:HNH endonuclease [Mycolicibacterium fortuitum]
MNACETWLPVPGFEGLYEVSSLGNVRSVDRVVVGGPYGLPQTRKGRVRKPQTDHGGYHRVMLYRDGRPGESHGIHKLVALAFHPDGWFEGADVRHLDGVRTNNASSNLAWGTRSENERDKIAHGTSLKTHCKNRHEFSSENTYIDPGGNRHCRTCSRDRKTAWQRERRRMERDWSKGGLAS